MKLEEISFEQYQQFLVGKSNVSMQMQPPMIQLYMENNWKCIPVGLFKESASLSVVGSFDAIDCQPAIDSNKQLIGVGVLCGKPTKLAGMNYTLQYGPYLDYNDSQVVYQFFKLLKPLLKSLKAATFSCNPNQVSISYDLQGKVVEKNNLYELNATFDKLGYEHKDLSIDTNGKIDMRYFFKKSIEFESVSELRNSYSARTRREVNSGIRNLVQVVEATEAEYQHVEDLMMQSASKHGYRVHGQKYYHNLKRLFGDDVLVLVAKLDSEAFIATKKDELEANNRLVKEYNGNNRKGRITKLEEQNSLLIRLINIVEGYQKSTLYLSSGVYIKTEDQFIHFLSGNDSHLSKLNGSTLIQDYALRLALAEGFKTFNMYGVSGNFEENDSVFNFKAGFGGYVEELCGTYSYQVAPLKIKLVNILKIVLAKN